MTARLGRWLEKLNEAESRLNKIPRIRQYGRLTRATGLVMEAKGLVMPLGSTCLIERTIGKTVEEVESEVVGFNGSQMLLMPLQEVEGLTPGARVYAQSIPGREGEGRQLPLGDALLGRVLDGSIR